MSKEKGHRPRMLQVRLTLEEYDRLKRLAVACGIPISRFVRERVFWDVECKWQQEVMLDVRTMRVELSLARERLERLNTKWAVEQFIALLDHHAKQLEEMEEVIRTNGSNGFGTYQCLQEGQPVAASEKCDQLYPESEKDG